MTKIPTFLPTDEGKTFWPILKMRQDNLVLHEDTELLCIHLLDGGQEALFTVGETTMQVRLDRALLTDQKPLLNLYGQPMQKTGAGECTMTLTPRGQLAGMAMQGFLSNPGFNLNQNMKKVAEASVLYTDALIEALSESKK